MQFDLRNKFFGTNHLKRHVFSQRDCDDKKRAEFFLPKKAQFAIIELLGSSADFPTTLNFGTDVLEKTNEAEVANVSPFGIWILAADGNEYFASYADYPVFESAQLKAIADVHLDCMGNLHWPALDADIEIEALRRPQKFPLRFS